MLLCLGPTLLVSLIRFSFSVHANICFLVPQPPKDSESRNSLSLIEVRKTSHPYFCLGWLISFSWHPSRLKSQSLLTSTKHSPECNSPPTRDGELCQDAFFFDNLSIRISVPFACKVTIDWRNHSFYFIHIIYLYHLSNNFLIHFLSIHFLIFQVHSLS